VRFLIDAQLPPALARWLSARGHEATHVLDHGLLEARDVAIWAEAHRQGAFLISKDEDFVHLRITRTDGPAVIWVRIGNTTRRELLDGFTQLMPAIEAALIKGEQLIEIVAPAAGRVG